MTWMGLNQCGGYAAQRGTSHLKCQRVRGEERATVKNRGSLLMFDRYTMLVLLQILSPVPALSYSKNGNKPNVEKHAVIRNIYNHIDQYIPHAVLDQGKCHTMKI